MTDFPDRDEWTDRPDPPESIEAEKAALEREKAEQRALYDEAAEWDELDDTDLIGPEERTKPTDLSNNNFSDV